MTGLLLKIPRLLGCWAVVLGGHSSHSISYTFEIASLYSLKINLSLNLKCF